MQDFILLDGEKIQSLRKSKGHTQEGLAHESGLSQGYISRIERGTFTKSMSLPALMRLASALGATLDEIIMKGGQGVDEGSSHGDLLRRDHNGC